VIGALLAYVLVVAIRRWRAVPGVGRAAIATAMLFVLQVAVGAGSAAFDTAAFNAVHVALATLVWSGVLTTALLSLPRADRSAELVRLSVERRTA
jgi:heme A synthase